MKHNDPLWPWNLSHSQEKLTNSRSCPWSPHLRIWKSLAKSCRKYHINNSWHRWTRMHGWTEVDGHRYTFRWWGNHSKSRCPPSPQGGGDINVKNVRGLTLKQTDAQRVPLFPNSTIAEQEIINYIYYSMNVLFSKS